MSGSRGEIPNLTVADLLARYEREVSAGKKGERWEKVRLGALRIDQLAQVPLKRLDAPHVADWQARRMKKVSGASVRRERNLLNHAFEIARKEWKWLRVNPFEGVRRPKGGRPRTRIATEDELTKLLSKASAAMKRVITIAVETGMRASEIAANPKVEGHVARLLDSKNSDSRDIPLSEAAAQAMSAPVGLTAGSISALFAKLTAACGIEGLTFHDLRRTATVRLAKKISPMELAKMLGHKDMRMTLNVYFKLDAEEVAKKL